MDPPFALRKWYSKQSCCSFACSYPLELEPFLVDRSPFVAEEGTPLAVEVGNPVVTEEDNPCLGLEEGILTLVDPLVAIKVDNPVATEEDIPCLGPKEDNQPYFGLEVDTCWDPFILEFKFMIYY